MNILITGSTGFVGSNLCNNLQKHNSYNLITPTRKVLDLTKSKDVKDFILKHNPQCIIHLASNPNSKPNDENPEQIINDNILSTQLLCQYAPKNCRIIFASSVVVYGNTPNCLSEQHLCSPKTTYAATKLSSESIINAYTEQGDIKGVSLRFCAMVGRGLTHGILYDFIKKIKSDSLFLEVFGNFPGSYKPFLHVDDTINVIKHMINNVCYTKPINVAPKGVLSVQEIADIVMWSYSIFKPIKWLGSNSVWKGDDNLLQIDSTQLNNIGIDLKYTNSRDAMVQAINDIKN